MTHAPALTTPATAIRPDRELPGGTARSQPPPASAHRFTDAWAQHQPALVAFVRARLGESDTANDIVQETFARLWSALQQGPIAEPGAWLFTVARNLVRDHARARRRQPCQRWVDGLTEASRLSQASAADPAARCLAAETTAALHQWLASLPPTYRQVLVLYYWHRYRVAEIAALLTAARARTAGPAQPAPAPITVACVKWRLVEARRRLARQWTAETAIHWPARSQPPAITTGGGRHAIP